jgi:hypothetical protein
MSGGGDVSGNNSNINNNSQINVSSHQLNFREKLVARLGNAQLSDSKGHNDSEGVLE